MIKEIKKLLKPILPYSLLKLKAGYGTIYRRHPEMSKLEALLNGSIILSKPKMDYRDDYVRQFRKICSAITPVIGEDYVYPLNTLIHRDLHRLQICSITVDFCIVLNSDINELRSRLSKCENQSFKDRELSIIDDIENLANKVANKLKMQHDTRSTKLLEYFPAMLYRKPQSLDEAIQKLLFYNALFWQMRHYHIGLGRLDYILYEYYNNDVSKGVITATEAKEMLRKFILTIGKDTAAKSLTLIGDTGQYILLGGIDQKGNNIDNVLTELFIELIAELKIPDPKLILRVNKNTSETVWRKAVGCIMTGIGSPLIMGEDRIMDNMVKFGYKREDVWNMGTSACWEPLIIGKSFDQNNPFRSAVAIKPLNKILCSGISFPTFDSLIEAYKVEYKKEIESVVKDIDFDCSPLFTLFFDDCISREKDFAAGGAVYAYHGAQVVSLPNTVNALLNIKRLVFDEQLLSIHDCKRAIESNFKGMEDIRKLLSSTGKKFGSVDKDVLDLTNLLMHYTGIVASKLMSNGHPVKIGFSSPNYIKNAKNFPASLDGRKYGDPFAVHISPVSSKIDISEILDFSSRLTYYDNCLNGNVVDFILPSSYIKQPEKLVGILKNACNKGIFELQLNVMDRATLIDAKAHPEKYPNLIVRVWGFSAYFNDLPEEFKDNLIRRAEIYEAA